MGVYNPNMKMPWCCGDCPFLIYRHYDMRRIDGTQGEFFKDIWLKTCLYEPEDKQGETEKHLVRSRAEWCPLVEE